MPNALETPWVTLEVNDGPLSLCNDLGRPNLEMISWSSCLVFCCCCFFFFYHLLSLLSLGGEAINPPFECICHDEYVVIPLRKCITSPLASG